MKRLLVLLAACTGSSATPHLDATPQPGDAHRAIDAIAIDAPLDAAGPYRHTIAIDGTDDFVPAEIFATTSSPSFSARITWDATNLYLGYSGPDLDPSTANASTKWVFAYLDVDPGAATGAATSLTYNTQSATFPQGFGAEYYLRYKCDATFSSLEMYDGATWTTAATAPLAAHGGQYMEMSIPRAALGDPSTLGIVTWMINEGANIESSYAGLYADNFTDGYAISLRLTKYLKADFSATRVPNDPANAAP